MDSNNHFVRQFIQQVIPISDEIADSIAIHFEPAQFQKNEFILKAGKICNDYIILEQGFARAFTHDADGNEISTNFYQPPSVIFEVASYFKRTASMENIQALTHCTGWKGSYDKFQVLFHTVPAFREFGRTILVNGFIALKERTLSMINLGAEQRYEQLLNSRPDIFHHASLKQVASYLGITDTSLSRIRKELTQK